MTQLEYYLDLRSKLYALVAKVKDSASWDIFFYPTDSNWATKNNLEQIYNEYSAKAVSFGLILVTRHVSCPNPNHIDYITNNEYGLDIKDQDERYIWRHEYQQHHKRKCICPCSPENQPTLHDVLDEIIYPIDKKVPCEPILSILIEIKAAINCSAEGRPRSGIRCHLLTAIMKIENQIIPGGTWNYFEHLKKVSR